MLAAGRRWSRRSAARGAGPISWGADLGDEASARQLARQATELGGGHVDILVNNAGIFPFGPTYEACEAEFGRVFAVNVRAPFFLVAELAPVMARRGHGATTMVAEFGAPEMAL